MNYDKSTPFFAPVPYIRKVGKKLINCIFPTPVPEDFSAQWFKLCLHKPEYGPVNTIFDPHIEWFQGTLLNEEKEIVCSRIYLNTWNFAEYTQELQELLVSDYSELCKEVKKISPISTLDMESGKIRQRMDKMTIQLLNEGYKLIF